MFVKMVNKKGLTVALISWKILKKKKKIYMYTGKTLPSVTQVTILKGPLNLNSFSLFA